MICPQCKKKEANVHFRGEVNGKSVNMELCEDCAKKSGLTAPLINLGMSSFFTSPFNFAATPQPALHDVMDLLSNWHAKSSGAGIPKSSCPVCHWTMSQFQKTGRMGCSECYLHFQPESQNILKKIHGSTIHKGKKAPSEVAKTKAKERDKTLSRLRMDLDKAVQEEQYELAAALRDKIRELEHKKS